MFVSDTRTSGCEMDVQSCGLPCASTAQTSSAADTSSECSRSDKVGVSISTLRQHPVNHQTFQNPQIEAELIKRRLKHVGSEDEERAPLIPVNYRQAKPYVKLPLSHIEDTSGESVIPLSKRERQLWSVSEGQENPTASGSTSKERTFGHPRIHRRKGNSVVAVRQGSENPTAPLFSPLVAKTRGYARADSATKIRRLQRTGYALQAGKRPSVGQGAGPRPKKTHQQKMEEFLQRETPAHGARGRPTTHSLPEAKGIRSLNIHVHVCCVCTCGCVVH